MSDQQVHEDLRKLFDMYTDFNAAIRVEGVKAVLNDLNHFYPECYEAMEEEFKRRQRIKELGVLLVNPV